MGKVTVMTLHLLANLPKQYFLPVFGYEYNMVLTPPPSVI